MAVFTKNLRKHIFVHPGDQHNLHNAIKIALLKDKKKYSDSLEGALLDVHNIKVISDRYLIVNGYFSMEVVADFEVFAPTIGMTLEAVINKVNRSHYSCLVMDLFNASLSLPEGSTLTPREGDACTFVVTKLVVDGDLIFMKGQLKSLTPMEPIPGSTFNEQETAENCFETPIKVKTEWDNSNFSSSDVLTTLPTDTTSAIVKEEISPSNLKSPKKHKKSKKDKVAKLNSDSISKEEQKEDTGLTDPAFASVRIKREPEDLNPVVPNDEISMSPKKHKKKHKKDRDNSPDLNSSSEFPASINHEFVVPNGEVSTPSKKHKKKHKRDRDNSPDLNSSSEFPASINHEFVVPNGEVSTPSKKHKKKHKRDRDSSPDLNSSSEFHPSIKQEPGLDSSLCNELEDSNSQKKHKKHKKKRESLQEESIHFTDHHSVNALGDDLHTSQIVDKKDFSLDLSLVKQSPSSHKKKRKSKHSGDEFGLKDVSSSNVSVKTEPLDKGDESSFFSDIAVKIEPVTPSKKVKNLRHKTS